MNQDAKIIIITAAVVVGLGGIVLLIIKLRRRMTQSEYYDPVGTPVDDNPLHGSTTSNPDGTLTIVDTLGNSHTVVPATAPVNGTVTSHFGQRTQPCPGASTNHRATDVAVPIGTPVRAPWDGRVLSYWNDTAYGGGNSMKVLHVNGLTTGYCHLSRAAVAAGTAVRQGDIMAYSGNTGNTTGPHLHVTLRDSRGNRIDPEDFFIF